MKVVKRDGNIEKFDFNKIINAVNKAFKSCNKQMPEYLSRELLSTLAINIGDTISIEEIQDRVEDVLMNNKYFDVAKSYIIYREKHNQARFNKERLDYMNKYANSKDNAASISETDANANVSIKNVANLDGEVYKANNRLIQRLRIKNKLTELFPEVAKQYEEDINNYIIYPHDESQVPTHKNYCMAATLYPLMTEGTGNIDGVTPSAPNDLQSFSGQVTNLLFLLSSQVRGAVALGDYFVALNYYVIKEFGDKWYNKLDCETSSYHCMIHRTIKDVICKSMKQFIYGINQPAGNRSYNSPFSNINFFDKYYYEAIFKDFYYPDGTKPEWVSIDKLQRIFMELLRELRLKKPLTFPVTSVCMLHDNNDCLDIDCKNWVADEWAKGSSFFLYLSNNPTSISSCCFSKDTKVLWKNSYDGVKYTTLEELHNTKWEPYKKNLRIFHNGSWIKGKSVKLPNRQMYKVTTFNNKEFVISDNHINVTLNGEKTTDNLTTNDYLMFNTLSLNRTVENDEHLTYAQGLLVGLFIGDGTFGNYVCLDGSVHHFQLSLNESKWNKVKNILSTLGEFKLGTIYNNVYPIHCYNKELTTFIAKWTTNEPNNTYAYNKRLNLNCLLQSKEFRQGILDGWYITDGGNSNRCYTISKDLVDCMEILCTSLGLQTIIDISDRTDEAVVIRGEEYNRNHPLYCLRWYVEANHRANKTTTKSWIKHNNSIYWRIKSIEPVEYNDSIYCIQCNNHEEPYFTLPCGLITHNCRVQNEITENTFNSTTGLTGIMTGSANVITLNLNRIIQNWWKENSDPNNFSLNLYKESIEKYLINILERVYKYQIAYKTISYEMEDSGMYSSSNAGYIYTSKLYCTIGVIGYCEAAEFLGFKVNNNSEYKDFLKFIFNIIKEQNKLHSIHDKKRPFVFNTEAIPGENLAVKLYEQDKKDGYYVPKDQNLYSSYFFKQWDKDISILDKLKLHNRDINVYCGGGQACHLHLDEHLSKEQYLKIIDVAVHEGCNYFTFNVPMSECLDCKHVVNAPIKECPKCHSKKIDWWVRIIGFLRPLSSYSKARFIEANNRVYSKGKEEIK